jgi:ferric iron reductase protein FhuF
MSSEEEVEVAAEEEDAAANVAAEASPMPMKLRALLKNLFEKRKMIFVQPKVDNFWTTLSLILSSYFYSLSPPLTLLFLLQKKRRVVPKSCQFWMFK